MNLSAPAGAPRFAANADPAHVVGAEDVLRAARRIGPYVRHTPLEASPLLAARGGAAWAGLKLESLQVTGSFKPRGAFHKLLSLDDAARRRGAVAPTAGNHGLGLARAGAVLGVPVRIFLPEAADVSKVARLRADGAEVSFFPDIEAARLAALAMADADGFAFVSAYNDAVVVAGQGTVGIELLADDPDVDLVVVCVGGGGLIAGVGTIAKALNPRVEVWGAQAEESPTFARWHARGATHAVELRPSIAEGLSGYIEPEVITWPVVRRVVDRMVTVSERALVDAMRWLFDAHQLVAEPSGVAALAAVLGAEPGVLDGRRVAVVVTGRNVAGARYRALTGEAPAAPSEPR